MSPASAHAAQIQAWNRLWAILLIDDDQAVCRQVTEQLPDDPDDNAPTAETAGAGSGV